ncbi:MAG: D-glycerate dehydrogenase [Negativicutes bacterium]|nr:D-glycerate dehydrogenase [Negativicutes bacterium]
MKVVIPNEIRPAALAMLNKDCEVRHWEQTEPMPLATLYEWLADADGLFVTGHGVKVDAELLAHAPRLRVIAQAAAGYENADLTACTARKIPFSNTPGAVVEATADVTFGIMLSAARRIHEGWNWVKSGKWESAELPFGVDLFGKTLGIVGMGQIGAAVAKRAQASGMKVVYHNRTRREDEGALGVSFLSFDELLATADFIVVMVPLSPATRGMFGPAEFAKMKPTAYFVNGARGALVDTNALYDALKTGKIAYAALDVTDPEPLPADHPLLTLPNILVVPHIGTATDETRDAMACLAAKNLLAGLARKPLLTCVNKEVNYR